jgi:hypothetical protein
MMKRRQLQPIYLKMQFFIVFCRQTMDLRTAQEIEQDRKSRHYGRLTSVCVVCIRKGRP